MGKSIFPVCHGIEQFPEYFCYREYGHRLYYPVGNLLFDCKFFRENAGARTE